MSSVDLDRSTAASGTAESINPHFLDHVVDAARARTVEASQDIVAGNGMKLLAKGARIDAATRERLLVHKLRKPLEDCVQVVDGVTPARLGPLAEDLLAQHPLLQALCADDKLQPVPVSLRQLTLSSPMQSLLTVYGDCEDGRLRHAAGVSMITLALARKLLPGDFSQHRMLATAGLMHDIGELYIDPAFMQRGTPLQAAQWRHIVTHPLVGHRVLKRMEGAGPDMAEVVLNHHERLDGFGYPRGVREERFPIAGQVLAAAEWLMALVESGMTPVTRASIGTRLIPGEFSSSILAIVAAAARAGDESLAGVLESPTSLDAVLPDVMRIARTLQRFRVQREWIDNRIHGASKALQPILALGLQRMLRIQTSFSSTGLDARHPEQLLRDLSALHDPRLQLEVTTIVRELVWRLRELERESLLRSGLLSEAEIAVVHELMSRLKDEPAVAPVVAVSEPITP
jgi:hypothetical protein